MKAINGLLLAFITLTLLITLQEPCPAQNYGEYLNNIRFCMTEREKLAAEIAVLNGEIVQISDSIEGLKSLARRNTVEDDLLKKYLSDTRHKIERIQKLEADHSALGARMPAIFSQARLFYNYNMAYLKKKKSGSGELSREILLEVERNISSYNDIKEQLKMATIVDLSMLKGQRTQVLDRLGRFKKDLDLFLSDMQEIESGVNLIIVKNGISLEEESRLRDMFKKERALFLSVDKAVDDFKIYSEEINTISEFLGKQEWVALHNELQGYFNDINQKINNLRKARKKSEQNRQLYIGKHLISKER